MVACPEDDVLQELADGELDPVKAAEVERHLRQCSKCRLAVAHYRAIASAARSMARPRPPAGLTNSILRRVSMVRVRLVFAKGLAAAAVVAAIVVGARIFLKGPAHSGTSPEMIVAEKAPTGVQPAPATTAGWAVLAEGSGELATTLARQGVEVVEGVTTEVAGAITRTGNFLSESIATEVASAVTLTGSFITKEIPSGLMDALKRTGSVLRLDGLVPLRDVIESRPEGNGDDALEKTGSTSRKIVA